MKKIGIIGMGKWGKNLIREFSNFVEISKCVTTGNKDNINWIQKNFPNTQCSKNISDLLDDNSIDAIIIATPINTHYELAKKALESGKHVFVEKPITLNTKEAEELVKIAKTENKILMVGHLLHYHPAIIKIKEMIKENKIGKIKNITCNRLSLGKFRKFENVLWSFAPHDISVVLDLVRDMPEKVICYGKDHINKGIHDVTNSILFFKNAYVNINVNWLNPYKEQKMSIIGEKGMIIFDDVSKDNKITYFPEYINYSSDINAEPTPVKNNGINILFNDKNSPLTIECQHFIECCKTRKTPTTDGEEGLRVLKVLQNLQNSLTNIKEKTFFSHDTAIIDDGADIGEGTKVWHYSHICSGAKIGKKCNIGQNVYIAGGVILGDNCKVQNNVSIYSGVEAEDYVFFGPSCVLTNDINPRCMHSKNGNYIKTILKKGVTLGANCTIVCGNTIGEHALIGAGAVICKDVEPNSVMVGNPGKRIGSIEEKGGINYHK